jgi:hypothetical protein
MDKIYLSYEEAKKESEIYMKFHIPSIIKVSCYFQEGEFLSIVMEIVEDVHTLMNKVQEQNCKGIPFEETFNFNIFCSSGFCSL